MAGDSPSWPVRDWMRSPSRNWTCGRSSCSGRPRSWSRGPERLSGTRCPISASEWTARATLANFAVIGNSRYYGGRFGITKEADPTDGLFDVLLFHQKAFGQQVLFWMGVPFGLHVHHPGSVYLKGKTGRDGALGPGGRDLVSDRWRTGREPSGHGRDRGGGAQSPGERRPKARRTRVRVLGRSIRPRMVAACVLAMALLLVAGAVAGCSSGGAAGSTTTTAKAGGSHHEDEYQQATPGSTRMIGTPRAKSSTRLSSSGSGGQGQSQP